MKNHIRVSEAAKILGVSSKTLRRWNASGKLVPARSRGGQRYYTYNQIRSFGGNLSSENLNVPQTVNTKSFLNNSGIFSKILKPQILDILVSSILGSIALSISAIPTYSILPKPSTSPKAVAKEVAQKAGQPAVLAASDTSYTFNVKVPSIFSDSVVFDKDIAAPNIVTSVNNKVGKIALTAGDGITIDGLKISNSGLLSLSAGSGISVSGNSISNSDTGSSQNIFKTISVSGQSDVVSDSNTDKLTFTGSAGITITTDATNDAITFDAAAPDYTLSGWTDNGTTVSLTTATDLVSIGGGLNVNNSGITNAGSITGGTGFTSSGTITLADLSTGVVHSNIYGVLSSSAVNLASGDVTGTLGPTNGGTGISSYGVGDMLYASASNTLVKLTAGGNGEVLAMAGGLPTWSTITGGGGLCTNCLINNPGSDQTITPTAGTGLIIKKASSGSSDIFKVTSANGTTSYLSVDSSGNVLLGNGQTTQGVFTVAPTGTHPITISPSTPVGSAYTGTITTSDLTAARTWTFPDATGIVCTTSGNCAGSSSALGGSGTANYIPKWSGTYSIGNSLIYDNGTNVGIGTTGSTYKLGVNGTFNAVGATTLSSTLGVTGAATMSSTLNVTGATDLASTLGVTGATTLSSTLGVTGNATFNGQITAPKINKKIIVDGNIYPQTCAGINSAIDALGATGGEIYLPQGTYSCGVTITIDYSNTVIKGAGKATIIDASASQAFGHVFNLNGKAYLELANFEILGYSSGSSTNDLIYATSITYSSIHDLYLLNADYTTMLVDGTNSHNLIYNNTITGGNGAGIVTDHYNSYNIISNNYISVTARGIAIDGSLGSGGNEISYNTIVQASNNIGIASVEERTIIKGNYIAGVGGGDADGIRSTGDYAVISGNHIKDSNGRGIRVNGGYTTITGNTITNPNTYGIYIYSGDNNVIASNTIVDDGTGTSGIYISNDADYNSVSGNNISGFSTGTGIYVAASTEQDNVISTNSLEGNLTPITDSGTNTQISNPEDGNLAIGNDGTPDASLEIIKQSTNPLLMLSSTADGNGDYLYVGNDGKVGIGTIAPTSKLHVTGAIAGKALSIFNETGNQDILTASASGTTRMTLSNAGQLALPVTGTGGGLVIGADTQLYRSAANVLSLASGDRLAINGQVIAGIQGGSYNYLFTSGAGTSGVNDTANTALGYYSLNGLNDSGAINNVGIGSYSLGAVTSGDKNTAIGHSSGSSLSTTSENTFVGYYSSYYLSGTGNAGLGAYSFGVGSAYSGADYNTGLGYSTLRSLQTGDNNIAVGYNAGYSLTTGGSNIFIGPSAGYRQTTASNLLVVDNALRANTTVEQSNAIIYGVMASTPASQTLLLNAKVGLGTTAPTSKLHVSGAVAGKALAIFDETGDQALLTASASGTTKFTVLHNGLTNATVGGLASYSKAGTISDTDFTDTAVDGLFGFDTTNHRLYFREGGAWSYIAKTGGFQIPVEETEGLTSGDLLLPYVESRMADGALHGLYRKLDISDLLTNEQLSIINSQVLFNQKITNDVANLQNTVSGIQGLVLGIQTSIKDLADEIFTKKIHTEQICLGTKDSETCIDKTKLDEVLNNLPSPTPSTAPVSVAPSEPTPSPSVTPTIEPTIPTASESATPTP